MQRVILHCDMNNFYASEMCIRDRVSIVHKITNLITSMDFSQSDAVSDTVKAAKYRIFFLSEDNDKISNENSYVADSREENAQKRIFRMRFTFKNKKYDKDKQYYLVAVSYTHL